MAAVTLDMFKIPVDLPHGWGKKAVTPTEAIISIASATSVQQLIERFHKTPVWQKYPHGSYSTMRQLYRVMPYVFERAKEEMIENDIERAIIWRSSELTPIKGFFSCTNANLLKGEKRGEKNLLTPEEREGETVYKLEAR